VHPTFLRCHREAIDAQADARSAVPQPLLQRLDVQSPEDAESGVDVPLFMHAGAAHSNDG
jgi:hypothetical protein